MGGLTVFVFFTIILILTIMISAVQNSRSRNGRRPRDYQDDHPKEEPKTSFDDDPFAKYDKLWDDIDKKKGK